MEVDYGALTAAASGLTSAASRLDADAAVRDQLLSGSSRANDEHAVGVADRTLTLATMSTVVRAQGVACRAMVTDFRLLDAQIASRVVS